MSDDMMLAKPGENIVKSGEWDIASHLAAALDAGQIKDGIAATYAPYIARRDELLAGCARFHEANPSISDEATQARATTFVAQIKKAAATSDDEREKLKKPINGASKIIQDFFKAGITDRLTAEATKIEAKMTDFAREVARKRREEAEAEAKRKAEEAARIAAAAEEAATESAAEAAVAAEQEAHAAARLAVAPAAEFSRTCGDLGVGVSSLRTNWVVEVSDKLAVVRAVADGLVPASIIEINLSEARRIALARQNNVTSKVLDIPGMRIEQETTLKTRAAA